MTVSPLSARTRSEGQEQALWLKELRDLARGFCGALFVALPLLYTQEMWERAVLLPAWLLLLFVALAYVANVGFILFEGYKPESERHSAWLDALTVLGIGIVASALTLLLLGRYDPGTPLSTIARLLLLEMIPTSFGASLAINQLGARTGYKAGSEQPANRFPKDLRKSLATLLGGLLFSFNIAPTLEPQLLAYSISWWHILGIIAFSLFVSALMVFFADFIERDNEHGLLGPMWVETLIAYLLALFVSTALLWFFGYLTPATPFSLAVAWVITLGYVTTLGGSAGRLVL